MPLTAETILNQGWCYMGAVLTLGCDMIPKINFAMQQNYIPFIRNLTVSNEGDEDISDVRLTIAFDPAFAKIRYKLCAVGKVG